MAQRITLSEMRIPLEALEWFAPNGRFGLPADRTAAKGAAAWILT